MRPERTRPGRSQPAHVTISFCQSDAVEIFPNRNRKFPGRAQQVAERRHRDCRTVSESLKHTPVQLTGDLGVEEDLAIDLDELLLISQQTKQIGDCSRADRQPRPARLHPEDSFRRREWSRRARP